MQTVSFAGSSYNIPSVRGDRPWSGLSDFVIAAASKAINTGGGNFTLLANLNFGATFGLVSAYYTSRTANAASAGQLRLANADTIKFRNTLNNGDLSVAISSNRLTFEGSRLLIASAAEIVNADISASAAIALTKLASTTAYYWYAANAAGVLTPLVVTASRAIATDANGLPVAATTTATELGYVSGVTSAIQTQLTAKSPSASPTFTGTVTLPVTADRALQTGTASVLEASAVTKTELGYVSGVTSAIQTQLGTKVATSGNETITGIKTFSTQLIGKGTATNDDAAAGYIGEYISATASSTFPSTNTYGDAASISLTAGDWDLSSNLAVATGGALTCTNIGSGISVTSGNSSTGLNTGDNQASTTANPTAVCNSNIIIPAYRKSLSGTATHYLKIIAVYSVGSLTFACRISARRVR